MRIFKETTKLSDESHTLFLELYKKYFSREKLRSTSAEKQIRIEVLLRAIYSKNTSRVHSVIKSLHDNKSIFKQDDIKDSITKFHEIILNPSRSDTMTDKEIPASSPVKAKTRARWTDVFRRKNNKKSTSPKLAMQENYRSYQPKQLRKLIAEGKKQALESSSSAESYKPSRLGDVVPDFRF